MPLISLFLGQFIYLTSKVVVFQALQAGLEERLVSQTESLTTGSSLSFLCQLQSACDALTTSNTPCPKLASLNIDISGLGSWYLSSHTT